MAYVSLSHVIVDFPIFSSRTRSLRTSVFTGLGGRIATHDQTVIVRALDNVSLKLQDGDRLGIVGLNGAGKTTLLRAISRVYSPQAGTLEISGKISSFTDITLGMDPEATGWQNIIFRCVFLGLTFADAKALAPSIAEFSELGDYLSLPVRTYSSGMFLRLAFAISTAIEPDIVVMDEMIGAGDREFLIKAQRRMAELLGRARILVLASHSEAVIRQFCNKALWLEKGRIKLAGPVADVIAAYTETAAFAA